MPEIFVGENFCAVLWEDSGSEKLYGLEWRGIKIFRQIVFVSQCRKLSKLNPFVSCLRKLPVAKKIMDRKVGIKIFRPRTFVSQCRKIL